MSTKNIITIVAAAILLIAAFLLGKSCNRCADYSSAEIDSVVAVQKKQAEQYKWYRDSAEGQIRLHQAAISELAGQLHQTKTEALKSKQNASYWSSLYEKSITAKDTPKAIIACDELQQEFENYLVKTDRYISKSDSLIGVQHSTISLQSALIEKQKAHIKSQDTALQMVYKANSVMTGDLAKLEKKKRRAKRWGNVKMVLAAVGGIFLDSQFK